MYRSRTVRAILREKDRAHAAELQRRDEMIQSLLDRIQHPERTPIWREPASEPTPPADPWGLVTDPDQLPA